MAIRAVCVKSQNPLFERIVFRIPGSDDPLDVEGRVVRTQEVGSGESPGMGIEFDDLDRQARERINQLVRQLRADAGRSL